MRFQDKLKEVSQGELWQEYCGFLELSVDEFMQIQKRLLREQMELWGKSGIGSRILNNRLPENIDEFRYMVPLTTYEDYADMLLQKEDSVLPAKPILWIQTTWEGGRHPVKVAPYTKSMLDTYKDNMMACFMLATSSQKGQFNLSPQDHMLYALAPLPYATGLLPVLLGEEMDVEFLPPVREAEKMSFSERNKKGFKMGMGKGIEYFFGLGSVTYFVSKSLAAMQKSSSGGGTLSKLGSISPKMLLRLIRARGRCKEENRELMPKDLFQLKGFMCAGTDNKCYKDDLEKLWGIRPMEIFAGTEPTCIGTETWSRNGMYFFPDACFYEFIPEREMERNLADPLYIPHTLLMDEVTPGEKYELVITVLKGGAFARYRVGDVYRCEGIGNREEGTRIPRFSYVDRIPVIIDIAGFTRITEHSISSAIKLSGLAIEEWFAQKEFNEENHPLLHIYVELKRGQMISSAVSVQVIREHLSVYFKYVDQDYTDLKKILGMDPLKITILKTGTFKNYENKFGGLLRRINPPEYEVSRLLQEQFNVTPDGRY